MSTSAQTVADVLQHAPVWDGHNDLAIALRARYGYSVTEAGLAEGNTSLHTDIPSLRAGGVGAQFWSVFVPSSLREPEAVTATLEQIDCIYRLVDQFPDVFAIADSVDGVRAAWQQGKIASLLGMEGGHSINESLGVLRMMRRLGVTYLTLTHNDNTSWAASATGDPVDYGLTEFGRDVVAEMNRIGMLVDLSHVASQTMRDALAVSTKPVIFSHSSCQSVYDHPRNVPDDVLGQLATNGGVQMVTFVPGFITADEDQAGIDDVVAHLEHAREVAGIDHIGLGGDYDGIPTGPKGLERVDGYPRLLQALVDKGWSPSDLAALTSGNILRVLGDAQGQ
ncbi:dipeptidase [Auritidibacter ignavus]|uniref:Dipeptidase n=1 Tax=Auritidibacter ignavus TaxID=678932 RepID=A0AAJ6DCB8_9MICC|nr:dipeptidase [Auritidibacter ignavus]WGH90299.1 dipeptidase [Auritidibacter ignavus]WGH92652.1 dipeptidase [Auritidibacter ignavus]